MNEPQPKTVSVRFTPNEIVVLNALVSASQKQFQGLHITQSDIIRIAIMEMAKSSAAHAAKEKSK